MKMMMARKNRSLITLSGPNGDLLDVSVVAHLPHVCCSTDTEPAECLITASTSVATDSEQILTQSDSVMPTYTQTYPITLKVQLHPLR